MVNINLSFGRQKVVAVVDIASGGATVALITCPKDAASTLLASARSALSLEERTDEQRKGLIGEQVGETAAQAMKLYAAAGHAAPVSEVFVFVHMPWARTEMLHAHAAYDHEQKILDTHIAALVKESLKTARTIDLRQLLEGSVVRVELNGYPTARPEGKYARSLAVTAIASDADAKVRSAVEGAIHRSFPVARISWRTTLRSFMTVARECLPQDSYLVVNVGATDTHIASVHEGRMDQLVIPEGAGTILKRLAGQRSPEEVLTYFRMLSRDACSSETCESLRQAMASVEPELVRVFGEGISKLAATRKVPNCTILAAHPDLEQWLAQFLSRIDFAQFTVTTLPLEVQTASSLDLSRWIGGAQSIDHATLGAALVNIECRS